MSVCSYKIFNIKLFVSGDLFRQQGHRSKLWFVMFNRGSSLSATTAVVSRLRAKSSRVQDLTAGRVSLSGTFEFLTTAVHYSGSLLTLLRY